MRTTNKSASRKWGAASVVVLAWSLVSSLSNMEPSAKADVVQEKTDSFLAASVSNPKQTGWTSVIAKVDGELTTGKKAELRRLGADIYRSLPIVRSVAMRIPSRNLRKLAELSFITRLSADIAVEKCDEFTVGSSGADVAFQRFSLTGQGVTVAVVDSGVARRWDLRISGTSTTRVIKEVTFVPGSTSTYDDCGHGTHVAGIIAANGYNSVGSQYFRSFYGIARAANIVNVRVLDKYGSGTVSSVIAGIQWVIANKTLYNIRIMNLSSGHAVGESYQTDPLCQAVEAAWKAGVLVVCASGNAGRANSVAAPGLDNEGYGTAWGSVQAPGNDPYVITVGAMKSMDGNRANDRVATYSGRGPTRLDFVLKPDLVAPGNRVISLSSTNSYLAGTYGAATQVNYSEYVINGSSDASYYYCRLSGTSMAAPVVSGAAALMLEANPSLTPDTIKARLMITADKWRNAGGSYDPCTFGAGYVNIPAALSCATTLGNYAVSPRLYRDAAGNVKVDLSTVLWGTGVFWGDPDLPTLQVIWGSNVLWGTNILWGSQVIWGTDIWTDDQVIWGSTSTAVDLTSTALKGE